jgi:hypothetical protein
LFEEGHRVFFAFGKVVQKLAHFARTQFARMPLAVNEDVPTCPPGRAVGGVRSAERP